MEKVQKERMEDIVSEQRFNELLDRNRKILVDVYTSFCGPCKKLIPELEAMSKKHPSVFFCKLNAQKLDFITEESVSRGSNPINGVPTILLFLDGKEQGRVNGNNLKEIEAMLEKIHI